MSVKTIKFENMTRKPKGKFVGKTVKIEKMERKKKALNLKKCQKNF